VTREHKLALIVGFSLVLLVTVLISDHFSRARQARIAAVKPDETAVADANVPAPVDPMKALDSLNSHPAPSLQPEASRLVSAPAPATTPPAPEATGPSLGDPTSQQPTQVATAGPSDDLTKTIIRNGGTVHMDSSGNGSFTLPAAVGTSGIRTLDAKNRAGETSKVANAPIETSPKGAPAKPEIETVRIHAVQKGETLFQIADKYYGTGHVWRELAKYNGVKDKEGVVRVGMRLKVPSKDVLLGRPSSEHATASTPPPSTPSTTKPIPGKRPEVTSPKPGRIELASYTVKKGDTLGTISQKVLGSSKRWQEIADLNKIDDEEALQAGTVLKVPPKRG
jgi:nucleoid-associated protein YgaU